MKIRTWIAEEILWLAFKIAPRYSSEKRVMAEFIIRYAKFFNKI